jgi:RNA ligase (TIGR02306 family)
MSERKLATVERIVRTAPIEGADNIELAFVRGWQLVTQKSNNFKPGDLVVYFEIDSFIDVDDYRFEFLAERGIRTDADGRKGHVLKTIRLRGQYSQGLILPLAEFPELNIDWDEVEPGTDVSEQLNVIKWEPPIPANLSGQVRGYLPGWISKTDEERIQNLPPEIFGYLDDKWIATEKIDGSSMTVYVTGTDVGVCSRNLNLKESDTNTLWQMAREYDLFEIERHFQFDIGVAIQGEVFGEGIQKNPLGIKGQRFRVFNVIVDGVKLPRIVWPAALIELGVPVYPDMKPPTDLDDALAQVENLQSLITPERKAEGVVWRNQESVYIDELNIPASFKVISNKYLLKHDN